MALSDAVLARRQKDLDGFTEQYRKALENRTQLATSTLAARYKALGAKIQQRVKALYNEIGATQDPAKLTTLVNKAARLDGLAKQIAQDLKTFGSQLQPVYTGLAAHEYRQAYYFSAFGIEQAAQVAATVPLLTQSHILGVLANPWLADGLTYAQRSATNMGIFALNIKDAVYDAVSLGKGWNATAADIMAKTNESYFRAVRLARTELNRASAMGASYAYMQNADILDGKQWNATLDSRTASRDALNDGKVYDLDYDTPDRPGTPGQRIPNHPHCRCSWRPILSAIGIDEKRQRIARDNTDRLDNFGGRVYTDAQTYKEYAKARGLPDLDDKAAAESVSRYLRPGETAANFNKTITRYTYKGKTIIVPRTGWDNVPTVAAPAPVTKAAKAATKKKAPVQQPVVATVHTEALAAFDGLTKGLDTKDRRKFAKELLERAGLNPNGLDFGLEKMKNANGYCQMGLQGNNDVKLYGYKLKSDDGRSHEYQIKTALHEFFHAKADGLPHNAAGPGGQQAWTWYEETAAETSAQFMTKRVGVIKELMPSYDDRLAVNIPKLKRLADFKDCKTIEDFGEKFLKYRFSGEATADWTKLAKEVDALGPLDKDYYKPYIKYVEDHKNEVIDLIFDSVSQFDKMNYEAQIKQMIKNGLDNGLSGGAVDWERCREVRSGILIAFNRLGVN